MKLQKYLFQCTAMTKSGDITLLTVQVNKEDAEKRLIEYIADEYYYGNILIELITMVDGYTIELH